DALGLLTFFFFFFSSRRRHTRFSRDWSSDVCSSDLFMAVVDKWEVETSVLGEVTGDGRLVIDWQGERIVDVDPSTVAVDGPVYDRPVAYPTWIDALQADAAEQLPRTDDLAELRAQFLKLLGSPNLADTSWIT